MNNFQQLFEEEKASFEEQGRNEVFNKVHSTMQFFRMLGDVAEVYLTGMIDVLSSAAGPAEEIRTRGQNASAPDRPMDGSKTKGPSEPQP